MRTLFKFFRILCLLLIFIALAFYAKQQKINSRSWSEPLQIVIYPMNGDNNAIVEEYIEQLDSDIYKEIDEFFQREADEYSLSIQQPTSTHLGDRIDQHPPATPNLNASYLDIVWWGLKFRYWAYKNTPDDESNLNRVRVYLYYHQAIKDRILKHSVGLDKGLLAIVHAFASKEQEQQNNIIIAHEFLHTVGATDKYNRNNQPMYPEGYAEPDISPLFPQTMAEIMAAKIPTSEKKSEMAESLEECLIGEQTAVEINWNIDGI